eukprot:1321656-Rhodomonas_salina.1
MVGLHHWTRTVSNVAKRQSKPLLAVSDFQAAVEAHEVADVDLAPPQHTTNKSAPYTTNVKLILAVMQARQNVLTSVCVARHHLGGYGVRDNATQRNTPELQVGSIPNSDAIPSGASPLHSSRAFSLQTCLPASPELVRTHSQDGAELQAASLGVSSASRGRMTRVAKRSPKKSNNQTTQTDQSESSRARNEDEITCRITDLRLGPGEAS